MLPERLRARTSCPPFTAALRKWDPINPVPPVTMSFMKLRATWGTMLFRGPGGFHELTDDFHYEIDLTGGHARVGAEEKRVIHDAVRHGERRLWIVGCGSWLGRVATVDHAKRAGVVAHELDEGGLADEVATEEHAVADFMVIEFLREIGAGEWSGFLNGHFESEPRAVGLTAAIVPKKGRVYRSKV